MKIYVEGELPKSCVDCPCEYEYCCNVCNCELNTTELYEKRHDNCPLKPLTDIELKYYNGQILHSEFASLENKIRAEERKKVVQEIRDIAKKISRPTTEYDDNEFDYEIDAVEFDNLLLWFEDGKQDFIKTYLDQIDRGE